MHQVSSGQISHTSRIADFVAGLRYEDLPAEVVARIKLLNLDSFGCAIYGADLPWSRILRETLENVDATRTCRICAPNAACRHRVPRW